MTPALNLNIEALIARIPLFTGLMADEIAQIAAGAKQIQAAKGDYLFRKGDPCSGFHLVIYGQVKLSVASAQGNEKVVEIIGQGQAFGEAIMFMEKDYVVSAQTLTDCTLLLISKNVIFLRLEEDKTLARRMLANLSMRLHHLIVDVESYSLHSGTHRVIGYLLRDVPVCQGEQENLTVTLATTKGTIASRLNLTQEHFSRILHDLAGKGLIQVDGRNICIPNVEKLRTSEIS